MVILPLGPEHHTGFALFHCARSGQLWTREVQDMIQDRLAFSLEAGEVEAFGAWSDKGDLVAIVAYAPGSRLWHISAIGTRVGHQRHGYATALVRHVVDLARAEGARGLTWFMHRDNDPMFALAKALGGKVVKDPDDGSWLYYICTIKLKA